MSRPTVILALGLPALVMPGVAAATCDGAVDVRVCNDAADGCNTDLIDAVDNASSGDRICIEGTFDQFGSDGIVVPAGITLTIDHDGIGRARLRTSAAVQVDVAGTLYLDGLTIDGGSGADKGLLVSGTLSGTDLVVQDHSDNDDGSGIEVTASGVAMLDGGRFERNEATGSNDGGHAYVVGELTLSHLRMASGTARDGGAIYMNGGVLDVASVVFEGNTASGEGGAIHASGSSSVSVYRAWMVGNHATSGDGGGIKFDGTDDVEVYGSLFCNNTAGDKGGGLYFLNAANADVQGSIFMENDAASDGGGLYIWENSIDAINLSFAGNTSGASGHGLYNGQASGRARSLLFIDHPTGASAAHDFSGNQDLDYEHNLFHGNDDDVGGDATAAGGNNDVFTDPLVGWAAGSCDPLDLVLGTGSPAIGAGIDGAGAVVDIGAFGGSHAFDVDEDGDGASLYDDCDDRDPSIYPGAPEVPGDGVDQDCDGFDHCYVDGDGDGSGVDPEAVSSLDCGLEFGYAAVGGDCDDADPTRSAVFDEIKGNGNDEDCDLQEDCYVDADGDGVGAATGLAVDSTLPLSCDDAGLAPAPVDDFDCDDLDGERYPGNTEVEADGKDQDCDGEELCWLDQDDDDYGNGTITSTDLACDGVNEAPVPGDCDDSDGSAYPGAYEVVGDGTDQSCDGQELCWQDTDGDGFGSTSTRISPDLACDGPQEASEPGDCADGNSAVNPDADEVVGDTTDDDCNNRLTCWIDHDNDGEVGMEFSDEAPGLNCNVAGMAYTGNTPDCDDTDPARNTSAAEVAGDAFDANCDDVELCFRDQDGDGYTGSSQVDSNVGDLTCSASASYGPADEGDCDDADGSVHPNAAEGVADGVDQDCDGIELCWADADGDGYGADDGSTVNSTDAVCDGAGEASVQGDCLDSNSAVHDGATDVAGNALDEDCDGRLVCWRDDDGDEVFGREFTGLAPQGSATCDVTGLFASSSDTPVDCDDTDGTRYPGAYEAPSDGKDADCDDAEACYADADGDGVTTEDLVTSEVGDLTCTLGSGYGPAPGEDCDDGDADVFPQAADPTCDDGIDNDCSGLLPNGQEDWDGDGIGYDDEEYQGIDDCLVDSDGDGIDDPVELEVPDPIDPADPDTDGDGAADGQEWDGIGPKPDLDGDGVPDVLDPDDDGDGVPSATEGVDVDTDGDGTPDREDIDDDGDGIDTLVEGEDDFDDDGTPDYLDPDDDGDGWSTATELALGSQPRNTDSDADSRPDRQEGTWVGFLPPDIEVDCVELAIAADPLFVNVDSPPMKDFDGDGAHDLIDNDDDGDGILTIQEGPDDIDGDGCPNWIDVDRDGDGKLDRDESTTADQDDDGIPDASDSDDNDGGAVDTDGDGIVTIDETAMGILPLDSDTSCADIHRADLEANLSDVEIQARCDGQLHRGDLVIDGYESVDDEGWNIDDDDGDGLLSAEEVGFGCPAGEEALLAWRNAPGGSEVWLQCQAGDAAPVFVARLVLSGTPEEGEVAYRDTDGDGLYDFEDEDDDGDGIPTKDELEWADETGDHDGDGVPDHLDTYDEDGPLGDRDGDGLASDIEEALGLDPDRLDSDGDGVSDAEELGPDLENPLDTDGDGIIDALDPDDDGDGIPTLDERTVDTDGDGLPDYRDLDSDDDGVDDAAEFGLDDDCDDVPDEVDAVMDRGLCDQGAYEPDRYERQDCSCGTASAAGSWGWLVMVGLGWLARRRSSAGRA